MSQGEVEFSPWLLDRLYRAAWAICGCPDDAEDLVQETFARVLARPRVFRRGDPAPYLMSALRNTYLTGLRTASRRPRTTALPSDESWALQSSLARPEVALERRAALDAIAALPEDFRAALVAVDVVGLSHREAGRALGAPEATIATRLFRARQRVARALSSEPGESEDGTGITPDHRSYSHKAGQATSGVMRHPGKDRLRFGVLGFETTVPPQFETTASGGHEMSSTSNSQHPARRQARAVLVLAALAAIVVPLAQANGPGQPRPQGSSGGWTRMLTVDLTARELGLRPGAPAQRLARAALRRNAKRLGLRGSLSSLRLDDRLRLPAADGARALERLRFQQTAGSLRVVWSQIDVTVVAGRVSSISATVVPVRGGPAAGERRVSRKRALGIARRAVPGAEGALRPLPVAYAGTPSAERAGKPRLARRAWVVEVQPPPKSGEGVEESTPTDLCIVVDAKTGKVIGRWPGMADRPDRGPDARGADSDLPNARAARRDPREEPSFVLNVYNGTVSADPQTAPLYAQFRTTGDPRVNANWPSYRDVGPFGVPRTPAMDAITANAANVARTICNVRGYCGSGGGFQPDATSVFPWYVIGNVPGTQSFASRFNLRVTIAQDDVMQGNGDPNVPANDVVAHEFGHFMDWVYAGDRFVGPAIQTTDEVEEALADMFAYEYDRGDATFAEETGSGTSRNWADPGAEQLLGQAYPAHMDDYDSTPPAGSRHFNSTILSHAYYLLVQRIGHHRAGRLLHNVPSGLSPRPSFFEVAQNFVDFGRLIYPQDGSDPRPVSDVAEAAVAAFAEVGIETSTRDHRGEVPG